MNIPAFIELSFIINNHCKYTFSVTQSRRITISVQMEGGILRGHVIEEKDKRLTSSMSLSKSL